MIHDYLRLSTSAHTTQLMPHFPCCVSCTNLLNLIFTFAFDPVDVTPVVVGVVVTLVIVIVVGVLVVVCCLCLWRRSKANQQPHLPVRAIQIQGTFSTPHSTEIHYVCIVRACP